MHTKVAFVLIDGIGDVSIPCLGHKTPLEVANTPALDSIAAAGFNGLLDPVEPGLACGSDTAHMSLFGYDPRHLYRGRGAFESMGAGLDMQPGDIAFKCNFACMDTESGIVTMRRVDRRFDEEGPVLCDALDGLSIPGFPQHTIRVKYATEHRCGVVIRGEGLTDAITGTDPLKDNLPLLAATPLDESSEAQHTAAVANAASNIIRKTLESHPVNIKRVQQGKPPANVVLLRGCGCRLALAPFSSLHGMRACMVAPTKIISGLGMCADMDIIHVPGTTGDYRTQFHLKAKAIAEALIQGPYEFGFLHVKAVDDAGHDGMVDLKVKYLEIVDKMVGQLLRLLWEASLEKQGELQQRYAIAVTGDHSTPVEFRDHSHEPVPFAVARVEDIVAAFGGGDAIFNDIEIGEIPHPNESSNDAFILPGQGLLNGGKQEEEYVTAAGTNGHHTNSIRCGDQVGRFTELDAAEGALGRFPGSQVMGIIKQVAGVAPT